MIKTIAMIVAASFLLGVIIYAYFRIFRDIILAIKRKNRQWLYSCLLVFIICTVICIFLVKPWKYATAIATLIQQL